MILQDYYDEFKRDKRSTFSSFNEYVGDNISDFAWEFEWIISSHMVDQYNISSHHIYLYKKHIECPNDDDLIELSDVMDEFIEEIEYNIGDMEKNELIREWENYLYVEDLEVFIYDM